MRKFLFLLSLLLIAIAPQLEPLRAQATGGEKKDTSDKKGEPITGLGKQDFVVSDQGKPQQIAFFSAEAPPIAGAPTANLPPNVFTNRFDLTGRSPGAVTGGLAFYGSNDIRGALKRSVDDGRYAYTIGFYPDHGQLTVPELELLGSSEVAAAKMAAPDCANRPPSDKFAALNCEYLQLIFPGDSVTGSPGFAVLVKKDGRIVFANGYGVRDFRSKIRVDAQTNFRLASFTKQFTAMAIMLLVHDGKVRYDQPLTEIFPQFPEYGKTITVRTLLNHTGGLPDYEELMDAAEKRKGHIWSVEKQIQDAEVLQLLENESRGKFVPGTKWEYSNSGYVVLGLIVAQVSGRPFADFLHERIFAPLKMDHTLVFEKGKNQVVNRAYGHSKKDNTFVETDQSSTSATQGDGGIYSNLEDLSKWDDALSDHTLLSEKDFLPAITPAKLPRGAQASLAQDVPESLRANASAYGFGWFLNLQDEHPLIWHYGDTMGFKTAIFRYTRDNVTTIVLCNRTDLDPGTLALQATSLWLPAK